VALGDFYTQVVLIAVAAAGILYAMVKRCAENIDKLENSLSQEGYIIQSHIWATNIKDAAEDLNSFIQKSISESESQDKYTELFSSKERINALKVRLDRLHSSYGAYLDFNNLFPDLIDEHEKSKKWLTRTIVICFAFAGWGATGFLMGHTLDLPQISENVFWLAFCVLMVFLLTSIYRILDHSQKCESIKRKIRNEKSKYGDILEKVV